MRKRRPGKVSFLTKTAVLRNHKSFKKNEEGGSVIMVQVSIYR
jgi:hypothetical protein